MPRKQIKIQLDLCQESKSNMFKVKQFDDVYLEIDTFMNNIQYDPSGFTCKLYVAIADDVYLQEDNITVNENKIFIHINKNIIVKPGTAYAEIELIGEDGSVTSSTFTFFILSKIGEGGKLPEQYEGFVAKYEKLIAEFKKQVDATIDNCNANINDKLSLVDNKINSVDSSIDNKFDVIDNTVNDKIEDIEDRFRKLTVSQQQDAEVIDARNGESSLGIRLDKLDSQLAHNASNIKTVSVKNFGAKGDGLTDDTEAIQKALNSREYIFFPQGTYIVSSPLKINMRQKIEGVGERSIIKANVEIDAVLDIYETTPSMSSSFVGIDNIHIDCNNKANKGVKISSFTNGSYFTNSYIKNAIKEGMYITNSWYAKYDNIQIVNCGTGLRINDYVDSSDRHDLVNAVNFTNIFINRCSKYGLHIKGRSFGLSFMSCTFENSGDCNIKIDELVSCISFYNCYCEASSNAIICDGDRADGLIGTLNLIGGYYNASDTMIIVGENRPVQQLNIIGASMCSWDSNNYPDYFIKSYAKYNLFDAHMHGLAKISAYYYTGYASGNFFKDYGIKEGYTHSSLKTGKIECVEKVGYGRGCNATLELGSTVETASDAGFPYKYQFKVINNYNRGLQLNQLLNGGTARVSLSIDHNNVTTHARLAFSRGATSARPSKPNIGECFYDQTLLKPIWWNGSNWTDATGAKV